MESEEPAEFKVSDLSVNSDKICIEVAFALPERQEVVALTVRQGCTALEAVHLSEIITKFPEIDLASAALGIFSRHLDGKSMPLPKNYVLEAMDRVEIYRPLYIDPRDARIIRVESARKKERNKKSSKRKG